MKKSALLLALSLIAGLLSPAQAKEPLANRRAFAEAETFLTRCPKGTLETVAACTQNQADFVGNYILAKSGSIMWMGDIISRFDPQIGPSNPAEMNAGVRHDRRQACAWLLVEGNSISPNDMMHLGDLDAGRHLWQRRCAGQSPNELVAIKERAQVLLRELRDDPTVRGDHRLTTAEWQALLAYMHNRLREP